MCLLLLPILLLNISSRKQSILILKIMRGVLLFIKVIFYSIPFPFSKDMLNYFIYAENMVTNVANKTTEEGENHFTMMVP